MAVNIRWDLFKVPDFAAGVTKSFNEGRTSAAYRALGRNPDDPEALNALLEVNPQAAFQYRQFRRQEGDHQREQDYRSAAADYLTATPSALPSRPSAASQTNALMPPPAPSSGIMPSPDSPLGGGVPIGVAPVGQAGADPMSPMGAAPVDPRADSFRRMAQADPDAAMRAQLSQMRLSKEQLDQINDLNGAALRLLAGVHDQESLNAASDRARRMYGKYGVDFDELGVPTEYDPDAIQGLMLSALETDKQLAALRAERRLEWDIEDDQVDNERSDRNTDSMIGTRGARVGIARDSVNRADARGRRGQDMTSTDRRRGQDMVDKRARDGVGPRPKTRSGVPRTALGKIIVNKATGERMQLRGGKWVPVS